MRASESNVDSFESRPMDILVGRARELDGVVSAALECRNAVVEGVAGIGKTRLLRAVASRLHSQGVEVIALSGSEATSVIPLSPLLRLCPPGVNDAGPAIISELYRRSRSGSVAVVVDDGQLLDDATAAVIRQLAGVELVGLVVAVRSGEELPLSIRSIINDGIADSIVVEPLDRQSTEALVARLIGSSAGAVDHLIWEQSHGHPLLVRELIAAGIESGVLRRVNDEWEVSASPIWSARLRSLMANRLLTLDADERTAMEFLAVGGICDYAVAGELVNPAVLLTLERRALVRIDGETVEIDHPLFQTAVLETISPSRLVTLRAALADAIEAASDDPDLLQVTELRLEAGQKLSSVVLRASIDEALRVRLPVTAEKFARAAVETGLDQAHGLLALALAMQWRWAEADVAFEQCPNPDSDMTFQWIVVNFEYRDDPTAVASMIASALSVPGHSVHLDGLALRARMFAEDLDEMIDAHEQFAERTDLPPELRDIVAVDIATCASHSIDLRCLNRAVSSRSSRLDRMDPVERARLMTSSIIGELLLHGATATRPLIEAEIARVHALGDPDAEVLTVGISALGMNVLGCHAEAVEGIRRAEALSVYAWHRRHTTYLIAALATSLVMLEGSEDEAERLLDAEATWPDGVRWMTLPISALGNAVLAKRRGEDPHAIIDAGIEHTHRRRSRVQESWLLWLRAQFGRPADSVTRLEQIAEFSGSAVVAVMAADVRAILSGRVDDLEQVSSTASGLGAIAIAAEAADRVAAMHQRAGDSGATCAWQRRVDLLLAQQPKQQLLTGFRRTDNVLSPREAPIVDEVLAGKTNREIADELFISHRTVESHLRRIYRRLGVASRRELTELLAPLDRLS